MRAEIVRKAKCNVSVREGVGLEGINGPWDVGVGGDEGLADRVEEVSCPE